MPSGPRTLLLSAFPDTIRDVHEQEPQLWMPGVGPTQQESFCEFRLCFMVLWGLLGLPIMT